ncbi:MBOAT family protein [Cronobacter muytjensii]|nr:MBOAT family protein [Cronobacter muytjensii]
MLFNSLNYILLFLPVTAALYAIIRALSVTSAKLFMIAASAYFYVYMTWSGAPVLVLSCIISYSAYCLIRSGKHRKAALSVGVIANVITLCALKYNHFIPAGASDAGDFLHAYGMPLAVSFFTFQQISFLVDSYKGKIGSVGIIDYLYYILFFPKMIAGPITRWNDLMPQTNSREMVKSSMLLAGLTVISIGLFKKVVLSGLFARYADVGYAHTDTLNFIEAWVTTFSYTAQIYFDFSGYSDIAIGSALLLGIRLPDNFNSPYKAVNIRDFWNRWHISLSTWLRDYVYIPLGGSRKGLPRTISNLLITFMISGAWHGSEMNFIIWGLMHGTATAINVLWERSGLSMPSIVGWLITFLFINFSWIPFRAESVMSAYELFSAMLKPDVNELMGWVREGHYLSANLIDSIFSPSQITLYPVIYTSIALIVVFTIKNTAQIIHKGDVSFIMTSLSAIAFITSVIFMFGGASAATFIYSAF